MRRTLWAAILCAVLLASPVLARHCVNGTPCGNSCIAASETCGGSHGHKRSYTDGGSKTSASSKKHKRSKAARDAFMRSHPCPANGKKSGACPGYVVDHIKPLKRGGLDAPSNIQWQTVEEGEAKDKWE